MERPLHEVFLPVAQGIGRLVRGRVWRMDGFAPDEPLESYVKQNKDGTTTIQYHRRSDGDGVIEIRNITPDGLSKVLFGEEHILKTEQIGSIEEDVDNKAGVAPIDLKFTDLFSKTDSKETDKSAGTSIKLTVEAEEGVEGVASFKESVETEAHAEISESEGSSTTRDEGGEEGTSVPVGKKVIITETRARANGEIDMTANGKFTFRIAVGKHSGGKFVGGHNAYWNSWQDYVDAVRGDAPLNIDLARSFQNHPAAHADLGGIDPLEAEVRYKVSFEGRIIRKYSVRSV